MSLDTETSVRPPNRFLAHSVRSAVIAIGAVSAAAVVFLLWLVYGRVGPGGVCAHRLTFLPASERGVQRLERAGVGSGVRVYPAAAGDRAPQRDADGVLFFVAVPGKLHHQPRVARRHVRYPVGAAHRTLYLSMLASHVFLSIVALPLVFLTFFPVVERPVRVTQKGRALDVPDLVLRVGDGRVRVPDAARGARLHLIIAKVAEFQLGQVIFRGYGNVASFWIQRRGIHAMPVLHDKIVFAKQVRIIPVSDRASV